MGFSSSKNKTSVTPSDFNKPQITAAGSALTDAYTSTQPYIQQVTSTLGAQLPQLGQKAFGTDPGISAATAYDGRVLGGEFLGQGNPYLGQMLDSTAADVTNRVSTQFGAAGRTGSGANAFALSKGLAQAENGLRYADYDAERGRMASAAALAPTLGAAQYQGLGAYLQAAGALTGIPLDAARSYAGGLGALYSPYNTTETKTSPGLGLILAQAAGNVASSYAAGMGGGVR